MASTTTNMPLDSTTKGGVLKFQLTGDGDKIIEFPRSFIKYSQWLVNLIDDMGEISDIVPIQQRIGSDFMEFFIKYCTWMEENPEVVNKRYLKKEKGEDEEDEEETLTLDKEAELSDWEKELFFEMNKRFNNGYQITEWEKADYLDMGSMIKSETRSFKDLDKDGKPKIIKSEKRVVKDDEERAKFNEEGSIILEKNEEKVVFEYKEYIDEPYQTVFTSLIYCVDFFHNDFMKHAIEKFFAQEIMPFITPEELKKLSKEEFEAMNFKDRYIEYDSNRDKLDYEKIDELDRHALPKRTSKEMANLMGRNWIKNPHATDDPVEYLNDPLQIYTLVCPGPKKCNAKECVNYQGGKKNDDDNDDN